jgi:hypothetical protein
VEPASVVSSPALERRKAVMFALPPALSTYTSEPCEVTLMGARGRTPPDP